MANNKKKVSLKGHCHAIWQLYKKLEGVYASTEFKTDDLVLSLKTTVSCRLSLRMAWMERD